MKRVILLALALLTSLSMFPQGHNIKVRVKGIADADIILGYHKDKNLIPVDTAHADKSGWAVFKGDKKYIDGVYLIYLPTRTYFDFIMGDDQDFTIETDTADLIGDLKITGSPDNEVFLKYQKYMTDLGEQAQKIEKKLKEAKDDKTKEKYQNQLKELNDQRIKYVKELAAKYPDLFVSKFLLATIDVQMPDSVEERIKKEAGGVDSVEALKRYLWYKNHYFDNFDISDPAMLRTPFYSNKVDYYLDHVIIQHPDSLIQATDYLLAKTRNNKELYKYMLIHLFNKYARSKLMIAENVYVHLAQIYIRDADWSSKEFINRLKSRIAKQKNCLIGNIAPDMHLAVLPNDSAAINKLRIPLKAMKEQGLELEKKYPDFNDRIDKLSSLLLDYMSYFPQYIDLKDIDANYIILWFMDPECSHCRQETPELYKDYVDKLQKYNVVVLDVYLPRNTDDWARFCNHINKWFNFVEKHQLYADGWINAWNPFDNHRFNYDINATPKVYLLDKNKKIIAKNLGPKQLVDLIEKMESKKQSKN